MTAKGVFAEPRHCAELNPVEIRSLCFFTSRFEIDLADQIKEDECFWDRNSNMGIHRLQSRETLTANDTHPRLMHDVFYLQLEI